MLVNTFFEERVEDLLSLAKRVEDAFGAAGLEYRLVGGMAAYLHVEARRRHAGRLTEDIDIVVRREDIPKIAKAVEPLGLRYRHAAGVDMLVQTDGPTARRAVHLVFTGEKVRAEYPEATPELGEPRILRGFRVVSIADLVRMKLTSFRLKDQVHIQDLDRFRLISPDIEAELSPLLRERLAQVRATR